MTKGQTKLEGMPKPDYEFEGEGYGKFKLAIGGGAAIPIEAPIVGNHVIRFTAEARTVAVKHHAKSRTRTNIVHLDADSFRITKITEIEEEEQE